MTPIQICVFIIAKQKQTKINNAFFFWANATTKKHFSQNVTFFFNNSFI